MMIEHDGRLLPVQSGERTVLPTDEVVYYKSFSNEYLGEDFEFTGRMMFERNEGWSEVRVSFEVVGVYERRYGIFNHKVKNRVFLKWIGADFFVFDKEYPTTETIVDCCLEK